MRTSTLGSVLTTFAVAAATTAVLGSGPAHAGVPATPTTTSLAQSGRTTLVAPYRTALGSLSGQVAAGDGTQVTTGTIELQRKLPGGSWTDVRSDDSPSFFDYGAYGSRALGNVKYRAHFLGGTDGTTVWAPSYSGVVTVRTMWILHEQGTCVGGCRMHGTLSPKAKHHLVLIQVRRHGTWHRYERVKTDGHSRWKAPVVATFGKGTYYRAVALKSTREIATASHVYRFYKVRVPRAVSSR